MRHPGQDSWSSWRPAQQGSVSNPGQDSWTSWPQPQQDSLRHPGQDSCSSWRPAQQGSVRNPGQDSLTSWPQPQQDTFAPSTRPRFDSGGTARFGAQFAARPLMSPPVLRRSQTFGGSRFGRRCRPATHCWLLRSAATQSQATGAA